MKDKQIIKKKTINKCKYCGQKTSSIDPNILCDECQEVFGHSSYSSL